MRFIVTHLMVATLAAVMAWNVQGCRLGSEIAALKAQYAAESAKAQADTRARELAFNQRLKDAQDEAAKRETKLRSDAAAARRTVDGLRGTLYEFRASLPGATHSAIVARADTAAELLGACVNEYRSVAEAADRIASDRQTLIDAWPR